MKKSLVFMIAVLLVGALMISCNGDVSNNSDSLATVSLKTDASKGLSTTPTSTVVGVDSLYWYFTATKTDGSMFTTGATSTQTPVVSEGSTGLVNQFIGGNNKRLFSTGRWSFSFYGYKDYDSNNSPAYSDLVYKCENLAVTITGDTELTLTLETVSSSPAQLTLASGNDAPYWTYTDAINGANLTLKIYDGSTLLATSTATVTDHKATFTQLAGDNVSAGAVTLTPGIHSLDFEVWYDGEKVGKSTLNLNAKANNSYPVKGDIENLDATYSVKIISTTTAQLETNSLTNNVMSVTITPQAASSGTSSALTTSVDFSDASNVSSAENTTYSLAVDVLAGTGASTIGVSEESTNVNVANIDLTLTKTTTTDSGTTVENVTSFGSGYVTVETYIGVGLTNVKVNGVGVGANAENGVSDVTYDSATGKLTFRTTHFSEFAVTSDAVASIGTGENTKYYSSFLGALSAAKTTDTVKLLADVDIGYDNYKSNPYNTITARQKSFVCAYNPVFIRCSLDLNDNTLSTPNFSLVVASDNVTVSNGTIIAYKVNNFSSYDKATVGSYALVVMADNVEITDVTTSGGLSIGGSLDGGDETPGAKGALNTIISGCDITAPGVYYAIVSQTGSRGQAYSNCTLSKPNSTQNIVAIWGTAGDMGNAGDVNELSFENVICLQNPFLTPAAEQTSYGFTRSATDSDGGYTITGSGDYASGTLTVTKANEQYTLNGTLRYIIH